MIDLPCLEELEPTPDSSMTGDALVWLTGRLYRAAQVRHPRCARFSLQNSQGLFFVKVYRAELVTLAQNWPPGTRVGVVGELHSFVSRRCQNHHVFIKAVALFELEHPPASRGSFYPEINAPVSQYTHRAAAP